MKCIHGHISLKNYTKVFCIITGINSFRAKINNINRKIYIIWIKQEIYSVLFGLTDNLFDIIHENTSLIQDSILEKVDEARLGENDK